jgi:hypothetical protein
VISQEILKHEIPKHWDRHMWPQNSVITCGLISRTSKKKGLGPDFRIRNPRKRGFVPVRRTKIYK